MLMRLIRNNCISPEGREYSWADRIEKSIRKLRGKNRKADFYEVSLDIKNASPEKMQK